LDTLILLAPGGRICYMGTRTEAVTYFDKLGYPCPAETNPAECKFTNQLSNTKCFTYNDIAIHLIITDL
jgi:hypothetical protein